MRRDCWGGRRKAPLELKVPFPPPYHLAAGAGDGHVPAQGSREVRPQPSPRNQPSILRNCQEDVARGCESSPAADTKPSTPTPANHLAEKGTQGWCPSTHPRPLALLQTKAGDKRPQKPFYQVRTRNTTWGSSLRRMPPSAGASGNSATS